MYDLPKAGYTHNNIGRHWPVKKKKRPTFGWFDKHAGKPMAESTNQSVLMGFRPSAGGNAVLTSDRYFFCLTLNKKKTVGYYALL